MFRSLSFPLLIAASLIGTGCSGVRKYPPLRIHDPARLVETGATSTRRASPKNSSVRAVQYRPRNLLVLSGGGANGTYTAGVLAGWSERGDRPVFDVVTGISIGAIIAPFAFLGSDYDDILVHNSRLRGRDIYRRRSLPALLWSDSLADSAPLQRRLNELVTDELLDEIAQEHENGRRLYVGTTNLDTKKLVVWDMGAIAAGDDPDKLKLFRKILLASAAVPPLLPSVPIHVEVNGNRHTELHVDGGTTAALFLHPSMLGMESSKAPPAASRDQNVYVILASSLQQPVSPVERTITRVAGESLSSVLHAKMIGELRKIYSMTRTAGASFHLASIPPGLQNSGEGMAFDRNLMRKLFDEGYRSAAEGRCWHDTLPSELSTDDVPKPRSGVHFEVKESPPVDAPPKPK